jgi:hypothetical protein
VFPVVDADWLHFIADGLLDVHDILEAILDSRRISQDLEECLGHESEELVVPGVGKRLRPIEPRVGNRGPRTVLLDEGVDDVRIRGFRRILDRAKADLVP